MSVLSLLSLGIVQTPPLSGPWTAESSAPYADLCQFGPHLAL